VRQHDDAGQNPLDSQLEFMNELLDEGAALAGSIVEIGSHTWAIHGQVPVDGEVIMAEFDTVDEARTALGRLDST
jgi:hypothetical protein